MRDIAIFLAVLAAVDWWIRRTARRDVARVVRPASGKWLAEHRAERRLRAQGPHPHSPRGDAPSFLDRALDPYEPKR